MGVEMETEDEIREDDWEKNSVHKWFEIDDWLHWFLEKSRLKIEFQIQLPVHKRSW